MDYFFGMPRSLNQGGIALNKPIINIIGTDEVNAEAKKNYAMQIGMVSSALEHITPEQMFTDGNNPREAVSAVRAIQKAAQQGQRFYQVTQQNQARTLPNIHHDPSTMDEIRNAVNTGKEVITHTDAISVSGWSGARYIIIDPITGNGAYKIAGGSNGGGLFDNLINKVSSQASLLGDWMMEKLSSVLGAIGAIFEESNGAAGFAGKIAGFISLVSDFASVVQQCTGIELLSGLGVMFGGLLTAAGLPGFFAGFFAIPTLITIMYSLIAGLVLGVILTAYINTQCRD